MNAEKKDLKTCTLPVVGMGCAACAVKVDKALHSVDGVENAGVNFAASTAKIEYDGSCCDVDKIREAVRAAGYDLLVGDREQATAKMNELQSRHYRHLKHACLGAWILWLPIMVGTFAFGENIVAKYCVATLATISLFVFGKDFYVNALKQLRHFSFNMDSLVAGSTGVAYLFSLFNLFIPEFWLAHGIEPHLYFETATGLVAFILTGRTLESRAKKRTSAAIVHLMELRPKRVTIVVGDNAEKKIPISLVKEGDVVIVHPGEHIAVDGTVVAGSSYVDESMLSGEPVPVFKSIGTQVFSGTANGDGVFRFKAEKTGDNTVLARIIDMVEEAQGSRAPIQNIVDKIAGIFVPVIIGIALLAFCCWYFFAPVDGFSHGLLTMITVLIIACPCALGLATPTAIMVGIGRGAQSGILIKDAESLQTARKIDTVIIDKTGTLTEGKPVVTDIVWNETVDEVDMLKKILLNLERLSEHPLAKAVVDALGDIAAGDVVVDDVHNLAGEGISGSVSGQTYYVGKSTLLTKAGVTVPAAMQKKAEAWLSSASTLVWFADGQRVLAVLSLRDKVKANAAATVASLQRMGIDVCLLTGDNRLSAEAAAREVGITSVEAGLLPHEKAAFVQSLQRAGHCLAMVGDGINDSAALASADLSIAMGRGSDIAMDAAQVTILSSDIGKIPEMIRLSRATMRILRQNLFWALIYNSISVPIAAGILYPFCGLLLHPMIGGAAMSLSSVSVVSNSLRLRKAKLK